MTTVLTIFAALLMGFVGIRYSYLTVKRRLQPVLTTWLLFTIATTLSLITYYYSPVHSLAGNIINVMDVFMCGSLVLTLIIVEKESSFKFSKLEVVCLVLTGIILLFWIFTKESFLSNLLLQLIITIAYTPTLVRLWKADYNPESFLMWAVIWIATLLGFILAIYKNDILGLVYSARGLLLIFIIFALMIRLVKRKNTILR